MKVHLCNSLSKSAWKQCRAHWKFFSAFTRSTLNKPPRPASKYTVALYATHLHNAGLKSTSVRSHLSAIAFFHKIHGLSNPSKSFLIEKLLAGYRKQDKPIPVRRPISIQLLQSLIGALHTDRALTSYDKSLYKALFSVMYHAALRSSEVCFARNSAHALTQNEINLFRHKGSTFLKITLHSCKHSRQPIPPMILHPASHGACPVKLYYKFSKLRVSQGSLAFRFEDGSPLTRRVLSTVLKNVLPAIHCNPHYFNTHSFRIGRATDMSREGFSTTQIAAAGRWKSDAFLRYIKPSYVHCH